MFVHYSYEIKKSPCIFIQGDFIFIQLLPAEGQEQNSDLTEVYIIFIQKSTFSIHPHVFPKSGPVHRVARERRISELQKNPPLRNFFLKKIEDATRLHFPETASLRRSAEGCQRPSLKEPHYCGTFC